MGVTFKASFAHRTKMELEEYRFLAGPNVSPMRLKAVIQPGRTSRGRLGTVKASGSMDTGSRSQRHFQRRLCRAGGAAHEIKTFIAFAAILALTSGCAAPSGMQQPPSSEGPRTAVPPRQEPQPATDPRWRKDPLKTECLDENGAVVKTVETATIVSEDGRYAGVIENEHDFTLYGPDCRSLWTKTPAWRSALSRDAQRIVITFEVPGVPEGGDHACWIEVFDRNGQSIWRIEEYSGDNPGGCSNELRLSPNGWYGYGYGYGPHRSGTSYVIFDIEKKSTHTWEIPFARYSELRSGRNAIGITDDGVFSIKREGKVLYEFKFEK